MTEYVKYFDSNKTMSFKGTDKNLLKMCAKIWEKVKNLMDIKFYSELVYGDNDKYIKANIKINDDKINTKFKVKSANRKRIIQMFVINNVLSLKQVKGIIFKHF